MKKPVLPQLTRLLLAWLLTLAPAAGAVTFKIATISPDGTAWMRTLRTAADDIARRTSNRVKLRFYPGGVMGNDKSVMRKIRVGQLHGGAVTGGSLADLVPDANVYGLPFLFRDPDEVDRVRETFDPMIHQRLEQAGMVAFGFAGGGFSYFMSDRALTTLDQLKAQKIWAPEGDEVSNNAFAALGIAPVNLPLTDVLTGLQTGLIDTVTASPTAAIGLQWHTRVRYVTDLPLTYIYGALMISKKAFDKLSAEDQGTVREILQAAFRRLDQGNRDDDTGARRALEGQGIVFVKPVATDRGQWQTVMDKVAQKLQQQGYFTPGFVSDVRQRLDAIRASSGSVP